MGRGADELFQAVQFGRILADGSVVVADLGGLFVRVYAPDGRRRAEMGREGAGPGEFRAIHGLWITPDDEIGVWDGRMRRITIFEPDGRLIETRRVRPGPELEVGNLEVFLGSLDDGEIVLAALRMGQPPSPGDVKFERWVLGRFGLDGGFRGPAGELRGMLRARRAPVPFTPVPRVAVHSDSIWTVDAYEPAITLRDRTGEPAGKVELPWSVRPEDHWTALESELRRIGKHYFLDQLDEVPRTDELPSVGGLLLDDRGRVWVKKYDPTRDALWLNRNALEIGPGGEWWVLEPGGEWAATVRMPDGLIPLDVRGDRLLGVARDALDVERVVVHQIRR